MNKEDAIQTLKTNYKFLKSLYIKDTEEKDFGFYAWTEADYEDTNVFWNHAVVFNEENVTESLITDVEDFFENKDREPAIYIPIVNGELDIPAEGYSRTFTDVWMFYEGNDFAGREDVEIERVGTEEEMEKFVELFYQSHAADLDDPYAGLSREYGRQLKKRFSRQSSKPNVRHYLVKLEGKPVGHLTSISDGKKTAIYNLGTIPDYRGEGIATATMRETVNNLKDEGVEKIFLQTEEGSENEEFFENRGFETKFRGICFSKNEG